jgi:hypothetical protein
LHFYLIINFNFRLIKLLQWNIIQVDFQ